jgi:hypothetical protein
MHLEDGPSGSRSFNEIEFLDITRMLIQPAIQKEFRLESLAAGAQR